MTAEIISGKSFVFRVIFAPTQSNRNFVSELEATISFKSQRTFRCVLTHYTVLCTIVCVRRIGGILVVLSNMYYNYFCTNCACSMFSLITGSLMLSVLTRSSYILIIQLPSSFSCLPSTLFDISFFPFLFSSHCTLFLDFSPFYFSLSLCSFSILHPLFFIFLISTCLLSSFFLIFFLFSDW